MTEKKLHHKISYSPDVSGSSVLRREDERLLRGNGRFVDDLKQLGDLHAVYVRSPYGHAIIRSIEVDVASAMPGVVAIYSAKDLQNDEVKNFPFGDSLINRDGSPIFVSPHYPLCLDRVRYVGDPVAVVIARSHEAALNASEAVLVEYDPLEAVGTLQSAKSELTQLIWEGASSNICGDWEIGDRSGVEQELREAATVVEIELTNNRLVPSPMEPRAARAVPEGDRTTLYTTSQGPHGAKAAICRTLGIPDEKLRVISPDVGGGFGAKIYVYPEETVITWASRKLAKPIRWTATRSEAFLTDIQGRDHKTFAKLALDSEGHFKGLWVETQANVGAYLKSAWVPTVYYAQLLSGVYVIPNIYCNVQMIYTNTCPIGAYRGAGRPEATYVLERLVDKAAKEIGIDRIELRRRNFIPTEAFPYQTPLGLEYDSGNHEATLDIALETIDFDGFEERRTLAKNAGKYRGIGFSTYVEIAGGHSSKVAAKLGGTVSRFEAAEVRVHPSGETTVYCGTDSQGQSHETTFAQLVSVELGIPHDQVTVVEGDTDLVRFGRGAYGSRSLVVGGTAIIKATQKIVAKGKRISAGLLEASVGDIEFSDGVFSVKDTNRSMTFNELAGAAYAPQNFPMLDVEPGLNEIAFYDPENWTYPGGCHVCELEVDGETGEIEIHRIVAVDDVGTIINEAVVHGQIQGGLVQAVGQALLEESLFDPETGQLTTGSFMDYALPRADDVPNLEILTHATKCLHNPLGAKGCGEVGAVGLPPAIINAVLDALSPLNVLDITMPATAPKVWKAMRLAAT